MGRRAPILFFIRIGIILYKENSHEVIADGI